WISKGPLIRISLTLGSAKWRANGEKKPSTKSEKTSRTWTDALTEPSLVPRHVEPACLLGAGGARVAELRCRPRPAWMLPSSAEDRGDSERATALRLGLVRSSPREKGPLPRLAFPMKPIAPQARPLPCCGRAPPSEKSPSGRGESPAGLGE